MTARAHLAAAALGAAIAGTALPARAEPPRVELVALVPAADARESVALGPHGELYEPDGHGAWLRRQASTIAGDVIAAARGTPAGTAEPIAATRGGPPFRLDGDAWTLVYLGHHADAVLGAGPRACAAVGRAVFALDAAMPAHLADAPAPVAALAAGSAGLVIETELGLARLAGTRWKPLARAPHHVDALLSDRYALVARGVIELPGGRLVAWPAGVHVAAAAAIGDRVIAAATRGTALELVTLRAGKLAEQPVPLAVTSPIVAITGDAAGSVVIATRGGQLLVRDHATSGWTPAVARDELPAARPGPPPARSR